MLIGELDQAVVLLAVAGGQPLAHLADELTRRIGPWLQPIGDIADGEVGFLELFLVDIGVVDAIDIERAQSIIVRNFKRLIMLVAKRFEEIHVDDGSACGDDRVDHVVGDEVGIEVHAAARAGRSGDDQYDRAIGVRQHQVIDAAWRGRDRGW